jgi:hypothetical protein
MGDGDFRKARGILKFNGEPAEDVIRRLRDGDCRELESEIERLRAEIARLRAELPGHGPRCAWCGAVLEAEPLDTVAERIIAHMCTCEQHPVYWLNKRIETLAANVVDAEVRAEAAACELAAGTAELRRYVESNGFVWCETESTVFNVTTAIGLLAGTIEALRAELAEQRATTQALLHDVLAWTALDGDGISQPLLDRVRAAVGLSLLDKVQS